MNVHDFIDQEDIDDAPEDPAAAFAQLVGKSQKRLAIYVRQNEHEEAWHLVEDAQQTFMHVAVGLGKSYKIEPFASYEIPVVGKFDHTAYRQFKADLDYYLTLLMVDNSLRAKRDSILIPPTVKANIRNYIHEIKQAINQSDFNEAKQAALHTKLAKFEAELEKPRLNMLAVTALTLAIFGAPGGMWASYDVVKKLTNNVLQAVAEAKVEDDENRQLAPAETPAALPPPRKESESPPEFSYALPSSPDLDDEIPF